MTFLLHNGPQPDTRCLLILHCFDVQNDEFLRLSINAIHLDLTSRNEAFQCLALSFVGNGGSRLPYETTWLEWSLGKGGFVSDPNFRLSELCDGAMTAVTQNKCVVKFVQHKSMM